MKKKKKIGSEMKAQLDDENFDTAVSLDKTITQHVSSSFHSNSNLYVVAARFMS